MSNDLIIAKFVKADVIRISIPEDASEITVRLRASAQETLKRMHKLAAARKGADITMHPDNRGLTVKGWAVEPTYKAWFKAGYLMGSTDLVAPARMEAALSGQILPPNGKAIVTEDSVLAL